MPFPKGTNLELYRAAAEVILEGLQKFEHATGALSNPVTVEEMKGEMRRLTHALFEGVGPTGSTLVMTGATVLARTVEEKFEDFPVYQNMIDLFYMQEEAA